MHGSRKRIGTRGALVLAALSLSLLGAAGASARDGHGSDDGTPAAQTRGHDQEQEAARQDGRPLFTSAFTPSLPTDPAVHGVAAGGVPWVLDNGSVQLKTDGRIRVELEGLVIPVVHGTFPAGTARPVTTVSASLYCAPDGSAAIATTSSVPISESGDAEIEDTIAVPSTCLVPVVLVHPNGNGGAYIAVSGGWRSS